MKIAQITTFNSPHFNGVANVVMNLSRYLMYVGNDVDILAVDSANDFPRIESNAGITIRRFRSTSLSKRIIPHKDFLLFLRNNLQKYDVIHVHGFSALSSILAAHILRPCKETKITVFTPHYHKPSGGLNNILRVFYDALWRANLKYFDRIIFVSKAERNLFFKRFGQLNNTSVVYNGINLKTIQEAEPFEIDESLLMYVGGLCKYKNIVNLVRAMPYMPETYKLIIIGSGPQESEIRKIIQHLGLDERISVLSDVSTPDLYRWYKTCQLVINLSSLEAFGIVLIEALAAGKRVLCSDIPSFGEIAEEFGGIQLTSEYGANPRLLAEEIQRIALMPPPDCSTISCLDWGNIAQEINTLYDEIKK